MEHGGGAPAGASSDMGQVSATFEAGFEQGAADVSEDTSLIQTAEFGGDNIGMADSHEEPNNEGFGLIEGQEVDFTGQTEPEEVTDDIQVSEPEMDPDESIKIAKNEGFEPALEYYASFGSDKTSGEAEIEDRGNDVGQDQVVDEVDQDEEISEEDQSEGEDTEEPAQEDPEVALRPVSQEDIMKNPEVMSMLQSLKDNSEIMKAMIERLEQQQKLNRDMLLMMALLAKENLAKKEEKSEDDVSLMDILGSVISFLLGAITDAEKEFEKFEKKAA